MHFVGLDLAWGEKNQTGVAAIDSDGRLLHVGAAQDDASIIDAHRAVRRRRLPGRHRRAADREEPDRVTGPREAALQPRLPEVRRGRAPGVHRASPSSRIPARARLATALDLDMDPASSANRRAIEVYPHPATVVLFELDKTLKYKRGPFGDRQRDLLKLMTLIEGLDDATPRLRANRSVAWVELRKRVEAATQARPARPGRGSRRRGALRLHRAVLVSTARRT